MNLISLLEKRIKPRAQRMDEEPRILLKGFKILGKQKLLAQRASKEDGGQDLDRESYFTFTELLESYSGALGFFQRQHQAAARFISQSDKQALKEEWLPQMKRGKRRIGVSVSHLRQPLSPCIKATATEGGWHLNGHVPWVSGYRLFDWLVMGFFCPEEGLEGMGIIRFRKSRSLKVSKPLKTIALSSIQTLSVDLKDHFLPDEMVLSKKPTGTYRDSSNPLNVQFVNLSAMALGFLREYEDSALRNAYESCREAFLERGADITLYAEMYKIASQLSHVASFKLGTRLVIRPNSIERRCRELMLFSVILPSKEISEACLKQLLH